MTTLYYSPGACSLAPHIVLEEIGKPFDTVRVSLRDDEHKQPAYLAVNPRARVPALAVDGQILTESTAICLYLADCNPQLGLAPPVGTFERARMQEWQAWLTGTVHIDYGQLWRPERYSDDQSAHPGIIAKGKAAAALHYDDIEQRLGGPFALGERYTVVDPYLFVMQRWGYRIKLDMSRYPRFNALAQAMYARPAVQRAMEREHLKPIG
jgi:glutathione S-transferase